MGGVGTESRMGRAVLIYLRRSQNGRRGRPWLLSLAVSEGGSTYLKSREDGPQPIRTWAVDRGTAEWWCHHSLQSRAGVARNPSAGVGSGGTDAAVEDGRNMKKSRARFINE